MIVKALMMTWNLMGSLMIVPLLEIQGQWELRYCSIQLVIVGSEPFLYLRILKRVARNWIIS